MTNQKFDVPAMLLQEPLLETLMGYYHSINIFGPRGGVSEFAGGRQFGVKDAIIRILVGRGLCVLEDVEDVWKELASQTKHHRSNY
jgi:hypothetical protein